MATQILDELTAQIGQTWHSDWLMVDQAMIDTFADATGDHQFIHVDPVRAAATPLGGTVAHGFLTLSLLPRLYAEAREQDAASVKMSLNYGFDHLRFVTPVRSGGRVRGVFTLESIEEKRPGQFQQVLACILEVEGSDKPALVATWLGQFFI